MHRTPYLFGLFWVILSFIEFNESLRISQDLKSMVGTGDPREPCEKQSQTPSCFWEGSNDSYLDVLLVLSNWVISPLYKII